MNTPIRPDDDHYRTPAPATMALLRVEAFGGGIWEPCAGSGDMAAVLREAGHTVRATTIGAGLHDPKRPKHRVIGGVDFLRQTTLAHPNIVTNPPFGRPRKGICEEIIRHAIALRPVKAAFYLDLTFLGGQERGRGLWADFPPARVWVLSDRVTMYPAGYDGPKGTTTQTTAWFVWEAPFLRRAPALGWVNSKQAGEFNGVAA